MKVLKVIGSIFAKLFSFIFVLLILFFSVLFITKQLLNKDFYKDVISNTDLKDIRVDILGDDELINKYGKDATVLDILESSLVDFGVDREAVLNILNNENIHTFISDKVYDLVDALSSDKKVKEITFDEIKSLTEEKEIKELFKEDLSDKDIQEIVDSLNDLLGGVE